MKGGLYYQVLTLNVEIHLSVDSILQEIYYNKTKIFIIIYNMRTNFTLFLERFSYSHFNYI